MPGFTKEGVVTSVHVLEERVVMSVHVLEERVVTSVHSWSAGYILLTKTITNTVASSMREDSMETLTLLCCQSLDFIGLTGLLWYDEWY